MLEVNFILLAIEAEFRGLLQPAATSGIQFGDQTFSAQCHVMPPGEPALPRETQLRWRQSRKAQSSSMRTTRGALLLRHSDDSPALPPAATRVEFRIPGRSPETIGSRQPPSRNADRLAKTD